MLDFNSACHFVMNAEASPIAEFGALAAFIFFLAPAIYIGHMLIVRPTGEDNRVSECIIWVFSFVFLLDALLFTSIGVGILTASIAAAP